MCCVELGLAHVRIVFCESGARFNSICCVRCKLPFNLIPTECSTHAFPFQHFGLHFSQGCHFDCWKIFQVVACASFKRPSHRQTPKTRELASRETRDAAFGALPQLNMRCMVVCISVMRARSGYALLVPAQSLRFGKPLLPSSLLRINTLDNHAVNIGQTHQCALRIFDGDVGSCLEIRGLDIGRRTGLRAWRLATRL
jgi:hypothetical protein